jgi:hypothetical protein
MQACATGNFPDGPGRNLGAGHPYGREHLATVLATMNLIAFAMCTVADLVDDAWNAARTAVGARKRFFEDLRAIHLSGVSELGRPPLRPCARQPKPVARDG